jgi:transcriptional regulator with PAS, ATPase and Fis domain
MAKNGWVEEFPGAVTVCDTQGIVIEMNDKSAVAYAEDGGRELIGSNMLDCHPQPALDKLLEIMKTQTSNVYTIEKNGIKKLIFQAPWYENGHYAGFVELSLEIPWEMPHFVRS